MTVSCITLFVSGDQTGNSPSRHTSKFIVPWSASIGVVSLRVAAGCCCAVMLELPTSKAERKREGVR